MNDLTKLHLKVVDSERPLCPGKFTVEQSVGQAAGLCGNSIS